MDHRMNMTGIKNQDTVIVRRSINKGTKVIERLLETPNWQGKEFKKYQERRLHLAGDLMLMSAKGTSMIKLSKMKKSKTIDPKGYYITTGRGTGRVKL